VTPGMAVCVERTPNIDPATERYLRRLVVFTGAPC
jgi:hypothetical protein